MEKSSAAMRQRSLQALNCLTPPQNVLIDGIGSGLDLAFLPHGPAYFGLDLTANMIKRARARQANLNCHLQLGNAMSLPYRSACFDVVILHLILAVTPFPNDTLLEACRVLKPNGHILVMDKFLRRRQIAPLRRLLSPLIGLLATQTNIVWEDVLNQVQRDLKQQTPAIEIDVIKDEPDLVGGWFRRIVIRRRT